MSWSFDSWDVFDEARVDCMVQTLEGIVGVDDFLDFCELDQWAAERIARPTLSERIADLDPDKEDQ